jgi:hypothetical protein
MEKLLLNGSSWWSTGEYRTLSWSEAAKLGRPRRSIAATNLSTSLPAAAAAEAPPCSCDDVRSRANNKPKTQMKPPARALVLWCDRGPTWLDVEAHPSLRSAAPRITPSARKARRSSSDTCGGSRGRPEPANNDRSHATASDRRSGLSAAKKQTEKKDKSAVVSVGRETEKIGEDLSRHEKGTDEGVYRTRRWWRTWGWNRAGRPETAHGRDVGSFELCRRAGIGDGGVLCNREAADVEQEWAGADGKDRGRRGRVGDVRVPREGGALLMCCYDSLSPAFASASAEPKRQIFGALRNRVTEKIRLDNSSFENYYPKSIQNKRKF